MHRGFNYIIAGVVILLSASQLLAKDHHAASLAPGFQFDQVDKLCVMPVIDARKSPEADGEAYRLVLVARLQKKGYRVADPSCSRDAGPNGAQPTKWRWILAPRLDDFVAERAPGRVKTGTLLRATLFDTESAREVWKGSSTPLFLGRGLGPWIQVSDGTGPLLSSFGKKKNKSPPSQDTMWAPMSLSARLYKYHSFSECNGQLRFDSGTLSFEPSSNGKSDEKCASFRFSVQGAKFGAGMWLIVPGKGRFFLQQPGAEQVFYLDLTLRSME